MGRDSVGTHFVVSGFLSLCYLTRVREAACFPLGACPGTAC